MHFGRLQDSKPLQGRGRSGLAWGRPPQNRSPLSREGAGRSPAGRSPVVRHRCCRTPSCRGSRGPHGCAVCSRLPMCTGQSGHPWPRGKRPRILLRPHAYTPTRIGSPRWAGPRHPGGAHRCRSSPGAGHHSHWHSRSCHWGRAPSCCVGGVQWPIGKKSRMRRRAPPCACTPRHPGPRQAAFHAACQS